MKTRTEYLAVFRDEDGKRHVVEIVFDPAYHYPYRICVDGVSQPTIYGSLREAKEYVASTYVTEVTYAGAIA